MKLSAKTEYACLAMLQLAVDHALARPAPLRSLADRQGIPEGFLVQILQDLRKAGLVRSIRGASGGYLLVNDPAETTLADVIAAIEGHDAEHDSSENGSPLASALHGVCCEMRQDQQRRLEAISLADLVDQAAVPGEAMWYI